MRVARRPSCAGKHTKVTGRSGRCPGGATGPAWATLIACGLAIVAISCGTANHRPTIAEATPVSRAQSFACGPDLVCNASTQYCSVFAGGPVGVPKSYSCTTLPDTCLPNPSCGCLPERLGCTCTESEGRLTVTCTAP
jgi:hypothetical protein